MTWRRVLRRAGPVTVALVVLAAAAAGCGSSNDAELPVAVAPDVGSSSEVDEAGLPVAVAPDVGSLSEAIAAAGELSGFLTLPSYNESCGLRRSGEAQCWGAHSFPLYGPEGVFAAISSGFVHGCGLRMTGEVDCWGDESLNILGQMDAPSGRFSAVSSSEFQTCGLRPYGSVECWGGVQELLEGVEPPVPDVAFPGGTFAAIGVGGAHVCGLRSGGEVACWGTNWFGQADAPPGLFVAIDAGMSHSCGLNADGSVVCWGEDSLDAAELTARGFEYGGDEAAYVADERGADELFLYPSLVAWLDLQGAVPGAEVREEMARRAVSWEPPGGPFVAVSAGDGFTCALRLDGEVACWGYFAREEPRIPLEIYAEVYGPHLWDFHDTTKGDLIAGVKRFNSRFYPLYESLYGTRVWELDPSEHLIFGPGAIPLESMIADLELVDPPTGPFIAVEAGVRRACGLRPDGEVDCWGIEGEGSIPPPGPFATAPITAVTTDG